jgi:hypothetical protein
MLCMHVCLPACVHFCERLCVSHSYVLACLLHACAVRCGAAGPAAWVTRWPRTPSFRWSPPWGEQAIYVCMHVCIYNRMNRSVSCNDSVLYCIVLC